ncbi:endoplasmic reticulum lectin 1-like [Schistocerca gregaria]|uniref:endoplasmic reticulum lectin 1-like n=1 Tax=Schistocerca gregaria TaxID=7010 RepID=UPI00211EFB98|nr:endoplasmic reticulum lectin 1-like [Schistocerca gregaria]
MRVQARSFLSEAVLLLICCVILCAARCRADSLAKCRTSVEKVSSLDRGQLRAHLAPDEKGKFEYFSQANGTKLACFIPLAAPSTSQLEPKKSKRPSPDGLFALLKDLCYYSVEYESVYEVCVGRHIKQYDLDEKRGIQKEVLLANMSVVREVRENPTEYIEYYDGGEWIEEIKVHNTAEIAWTCASGKTAVTGVYTPIPGHHVVWMKTPLLCAHEKYALQTTQREIKCFIE